MTDDPEHEADARLADALSRLHGEVEPPPGVEDRLVTQLRARGDIAGRRRQSGLSPPESRRSRRPCWCDDASPTRGTRESRNPSFSC